MKRNGIQTYFDHAAATPLLPEAFLAMKPYLTTSFANPSALYRNAVHVREAIDQARAAVAHHLQTQPDAIIFTSGGTESCATAILGVVRRAKQHGISAPHIITTAIEHHAVLASVAMAEKEGATVTLIPVNKEGSISLADISNALTPQTVLVSVMYVNNEIGTIAPIADIGRAILKYRKGTQSVYPYFHTDACQAAGTLPLEVEKSHVDLLSLNGSKVYGPKGTGILYIRRGVRIGPLIPGGGQEFSMRSGTENVAGIIGFATAFTFVRQKQEKERRRLIALREYMVKELKTMFPDVIFNGPSNAVLQSPQHLSVTFPGIEAESLIMYLDAKGIALSSGAACAAGSEEGSHVLRACGKTETHIQSTVRFSLGLNTTKKEITLLMRALRDTLPMLLSMQRIS